jgi:hypothetical protein
MLLKIPTTRTPQGALTFVALIIKILSCNKIFFFMVYDQNYHNCSTLAICYTIIVEHTRRTTPEGYIPKDIYILSYIKKSTKRIFPILFWSRIFRGYNILILGISKYHIHILSFFQLSVPEILGFRGKIFPLARPFLPFMPWFAISLLHRW